MKILHLSDFHLGKGEKVQEDRIIGAINNTISDQDIDICVFTGDVLDKKNGNLESAYERIFNEIVVPNCKSQFIICCGNHDVDHELISPMFLEHFKKIKTSEDVNTFVTQNKANDYQNSLSHTVEFNKCQKKYQNTDNAIIEDLWSVNHYNIRNKKISICTINTAWHYLQEEKTYKFPTDRIYKVVKELRDSEVKILANHFTVDDSNELLRKEIEDVIYSNFDVLLCGHHHSEKLSTENFCEDGLVKCISPSTDQTNGFDFCGMNIYKLNIAELNLSVKQYNYFSKNNTLHLTRSTELNIPTNEVKKNAIKVIKAISTKYQNVLRDSNKFLIQNSDNNEMSFIECFTPPVLKNAPKSFAHTNETKGHVSQIISYTDIIKNSDKNFHFFGESKSGKTVLAYRFILHYLSEYDDLKLLPFYMDLTTITTQELINFQLVDEVAKYYNISRKLAALTLDCGSIVVILDNYDLTKNDLYTNLFDKIREIPKSQIILFSNSTSEFFIDDLVHETTFNQLFIHDISRKQVRTIAQKWPDIKSEICDEVVNKITTLFRDMNISFNYWSVSLFLWIFNKSTVENLQSNVDLIELYIENLLEKAHLALKLQKSFSFEHLKDFLSYLAYKIYKNNGDYTCTKLQMYEIYEEFKSTNSRIVADAEEVIAYIEEKCIITSKGRNKYTFRLNGVFEYFLAYYMRQNEDFLNTILNDGHSFLAYKNELELLAGFYRNNKVLIQKILDKTNIVSKMLDDKVGILNFDEYEIEVDSKNKEYFSFLKNLTNEVLPLTHDDQDFINDSVMPISNIDSGIQKKEPVLLEDVTVESLGEHLKILGRMLRNSDNLRDTEFELSILSFIIDQYSRFTLYNYKQLLTDNKIEENQKILESLNILKTFTPIVNHTLIYEAVGHKNLTLLIKELIYRELNSANPSEYRLFILHFLAIESDVSNELDLIDKIIKVAKSWSIKNSILVKLIVYIAFKANGNKKLELKLKDKSRKINESLQPKTKRSNLGIQQSPEDRNSGIDRQIDLMRRSVTE